MRSIYNLLKSTTGSAVVMALIAMMLLGTLGAVYIALSTSEGKLAANYRDGVAAEYLAEAGIQWAITQLDTTRNITDTKVIDETKSLTGTYTAQKNPGSSTAGFYTVVITAYPDSTGRKIVSTGTVNKASRQVVLTVTLSGGSAPILPSSGTMGQLALPSPPGEISVNYAKVYTTSASNPSLGAATFTKISSPPAAYDYSSYKSRAIPYTLLNQQIDNKLYYYDGNLILDQNYNLSGTEDDNGILFVDGSITIAGGGLNINNVIIVATGNIIISGGASFSKSSIISNSNITFYSLALLQTGVLITPGTVSFNNGVHWNNSLDSDTRLVGIVNTKLQPYIAASGGGTTSQFAVNSIKNY